MFGFGKKKENEPSFKYDPARHRAIIRCSICTGEQVAGFKDRETGYFTEICLVKNDDDIAEFKRRYGVDSVEKVY